MMIRHRSKLDKLLDAVAEVLRQHLIETGPSNGLDPASAALRQLPLHRLRDYSGQELLVFRGTAAQLTVLGPEESAVQVPLTRLRAEGRDIGPAYVRRLGDDHGILLARHLLAEVPDRFRWDGEIRELTNLWRINTLLREALATCALPDPVWGVPPTDTTLTKALRVEVDRAVATAKTVPARYADGYSSGLNSARQQVDQHISALIANGRDRTPQDQTPERRSPYAVFSWWAGNDVTVWALDGLDKPQLWRYREARSAAQRVATALAPGGDRQFEAQKFARLLLGQLPLLHDDRAIMAAHLAHAGEECNRIRAELRVRWTELGLTSGALFWRAELASHLLAVASAIAAGTGGIADDFLAGFNSASNRVIRAFTTRAAEVGVAHELL
jgi:hypothetical protein